MLYGLYDMRHAALFPARVLAEATQNAFQNPFIPASYTRLGRTIAAGAELFERTTPVSYTHLTLPTNREV